MNLFNTNPEASGFKLQYFQVYNWGTFDHDVCTIEPCGNNSLLTGANASGKSTLIDAMLTLLVPFKRQRYYNQSSGTDKKGDRTEESYVLGNYGSEQLDGEIGTTTKRLRTKKNRSVLLATFCDNVKGFVTLFQVRYFSDEELKTVYGVAQEALRIEKDFSHFDPKGDWRKALSKQYNANSLKKRIEFYDGPMAYQEKMEKLFGMRSSKAFSLFNQIVGVKVLDDLDLFIRNNMLEEQPAEQRYQELEENFHNLMDAKNKIDKTREQINQLEPINQCALELKSIDERIKQLEHDRDIATFWFVDKTQELCMDAKAKAVAEVDRLNVEQQRLKAEKKQLDDHKTDLDIAIKSDAVGLQIKEIEKEIRQFEGIRDNRQKKAAEYEKIAGKVELTMPISSADFDANRAVSKAQKDALQKQIDNELSEEKRKTQNAQDEIKENISRHIEIIRYLSERKNNIVGRPAEIRDEILVYLGAGPEEIPFVGELIRVREEESDWEYAIERVLHHFALQMIVPERYYRRFNEYVNSHNLKGRIVYQRYNGVETMRGLENRLLNDNELLRKIEFKPKNEYTEWVEDKIYAELNYVCAENIEDFNAYGGKVVTREGLVKSGSKHEKDDRLENRKRENYVLGWNNKAKIAELQADVRKLQQEEKQIIERLRQLNAQIDMANKRKDIFSELFSTYKTYDEIDWRTYALLVQEKLRKKQELEATNDKVKALQAQLAEVIRQIEENETLDRKLVEQRTRLVVQIDTLAKRINDCVEAIALMGIVDTDAFVQNHTSLVMVTLDNIETYQKNMIDESNRSISQEKSRRLRVREEVGKLMYAFTHPGDNITNIYPDWRSDVSQLSDSVDFVDGYQSLYQRLVDEDLISFEGKFNRYLQETVTNKISNFRLFFQTWRDSIERTIKQLNESLRGIDFQNHPRTYLQLVSTRRINPDATEFNRLLDEAIPNLRDLELTIDARKNHFEQHIKPLMDRLADEQWRSKVMDVRQRYTYKAEEYNCEDNAKRRTYESMGQLSGGEKAQLTYTILGSAIAYQFGLTKSGLDSSFRFIAIDEAFRAQDEEKARYLISLCKQLQLQLLVVTPCDNIHIVENAISYVHYVERKSDERSILCNMPIFEFKQEREKRMRS